MKKIGVLYILLILIYSNSSAQNKYATTSKKAIKLYENAVNEYAMLKYKSCISLLDQAIEKDPLFVDAYLLKAEVYRNNGDFLNEANSYRKSVEINPNYFPYQFYNLGVAEWKSGKYIEANESFQRFLNKNVGRKTTQQKAKEFLEKCEFAINLINNPVPFDPKNIGETINNDNDQYWPSLSIDSKTLIYTELLLDTTRRTLSGKYAHQEDFFISNFSNNNWTKGKPIGPPINTAGNEGAQQLSADGKTLVFTGCNRKDGYGNCDIYFSYLTNDGWTLPENAGAVINTRFSEKQPSLSADGRTLFFSSNRPESIGGMDIFMSHKNAQGSWTKPINLGRTINTHSEEVSPFIHPDNKTFYFCSNGHPGLGNSDIFISRKDSTKNWSKPVNIGYPINTNHDEIGLIIDNTGEKAYYSSNKGNNSRNIYYFNLPKEAKPSPVSYITGRISDSITNHPLKAELQLISLNSGDTIMFIKSDSVSGNYLLCLPIGEEYALNVNRIDYLFQSKNFKLSDKNSYVEPYELDFKLIKIEPGKSIVLENIFFDTDSYELLEKSVPELQKIEEFLNNNPNLIVEIGGHTDNLGTTAYNDELSEKRAKSVYNYLISKNDYSDRLIYKGYGENQPIASNNTESGQAKNRRTELKIIDKQ